MEHIDELKQEGAGKWLHDHVLCTMRREAEAEEKLGGDSIKYLLGQFKEQRTFQSRPIPRQLKTKGSRAIEHILSMSQSADSLRVHLRELTDELASFAIDNGMVAVEDELWLKIAEIWVVCSILRITSRKRLRNFIFLIKHPTKSWNG